MDIIDLHVTAISFIMYFMVGTSIHFFLTFFKLNKFKSRVITGFLLTFVLITLYSFKEQIEAYFIAQKLIIEYIETLLTIEKSLEAGIIFSISFTFVNFLNLFLWNGILKINGISSVPKILSGSINILIYTLTIAFVLKSLYNQPVTSILAASGFIAFIFGYSAQATIGQAISGFALNLGQNIKKNDYIKVGEFSGTVTELNWRSVTIKTPRDSTAVIPNNYFSEKYFENCNADENGRYIFMPVYAPYSEPPNKITTILHLAASECKFVSKNNSANPRALKNVYVYCLGFKEQGVKYVICLQTKHKYSWQIENEIYKSIWYHFNRRNIPINIRLERKMDLLEKPIDLEIPTIGDIQSRLQACPVLGILNSKEIELLANNTLVHRHGPPERVLLVDEENEYLYFVHAGELQSYRKHENGTTVKVRDFVSGDIFGIKSMLTGSKANLTVTATTECILFKMQRELFKEILTERPELFEQLSKLLVSQESEDEEVVRNKQKNKKNKANQQSALLRISNKIKKLFKYKD